jgi:hypothetical protein
LERKRPLSIKGIFYAFLKNVNLKSLSLFDLDILRNELKTKRLNGHNPFNLFAFQPSIGVFFRLKNSTRLVLGDSQYREHFLGILHEISAIVN